MSQQQRQLAAILFTDIVGYTAMMQANESLAVAAIRKHREVLEKAVAEQEGDVIEYYGDGSLCIFSSATEALQCAVRIQDILQKEPRIPLRIGLHIGEILLQDNKVMGDGVNLASRIQSLGEEGSILFSKEVYDKIRNHPEFQAVFLGRFNMKNVSEPMDIYALKNPGLKIPTKETFGSFLAEEEKISWVKKLKPVVIIPTLLILATLVFLLLQFIPRHENGFAGGEKSIAVLPFENLSKDPGDAYLSDGITEDIITQLSKIADLKVISRTSVMPYKNSNKKIREIADELHVSAILEGSVRKEGNNLKINAQLIDARKDQHIWAEQYDRSADQMLLIQSEVAQRIAAELNAKLTEEEGKRIRQPATGNMEAYNDFLRAKSARGREKEKLLRAAIAGDSALAPVWAGLAYYYAKFSPTDPEDQTYYTAKSLNAALTAVHYGPELSETHMVLGDIIKTITLNPALSLGELEESIVLNPNNAEAYVFLAFAFMELGRFPEAQINLLKAKQLDPLSDIMRGGWLNYYFYSRDTAKLHDILRAFPANHYPETPFSSQPAFNYYLLTDLDDSLVHYANKIWNRDFLGMAYAKSGKIPEARRYLDSLLADSPVDHALPIGLTYAWMNEPEKAMKYLNLAYRLRDYGLISLKVNKIFDPLRKEPLFMELLDKIANNEY